MLNTLTKKRNEQKKKKGFTLIELIIVIAIIAILIALVVPKFMNVTKDAKIKADIANAKTIESAITTAIATDKIQPDKDGNVDLKTVLNTVPQPKNETSETFTATVKADSNGNQVITVKIGTKVVVGDNVEAPYNVK